MEEITFEFDSSSERIENGFEELRYVLATEDKRAVGEEVYERFGDQFEEKYEGYDAKEISEAVFGSLDERLDENTSGEHQERQDLLFNYLGALYAQSAAKMLEDDEDTRNEFYSAPLKERFDFLTLGSWVNGSPLKIKEK